jgi:hypothetical protein
MAVLCASIGNLLARCSGTPEKLSASDATCCACDSTTGFAPLVRSGDKLGKGMRDAVRAGASVKLGCDYTNYPAHVPLVAETLASLAGDLT